MCQYPKEPPTGDVTQVDQLPDLEEAIKKCKIGKYNFILIAVSGCLMTSAFVELTSINVIFPVAQCDLNLTTADKGILGSIGYVGVILSSHLWGFLSDTRGRTTILIPTLLVAFLMTFLSSLVNNFWLMLILRFLNGFFISCASSTTFAYLGEFHSASHRAKVLLVASIIYSMTSLSLPTFAVLIINQKWTFDIAFLGIEYKPWRLFLLVCSLPNLICAFFLKFILTESPKFTYSKGDEAATLEILRKIFRMNTNKSILEYDVKQIKKTEEFGSNLNKPHANFLKSFWDQSTPLFKGKHLRNILTACFLQFSICNATNGFWPFFPEIINRVSLFLAPDSSKTATICEIFNAYETVGNATGNGTGETVCIDTLEFETFFFMYILVTLYIIFYTIISFSINWAGKLWNLEIVLVLTGASALGVIFIEVPVVSSVFILILLLSGLGIVVVNASTIELFPTKMRAMAVCVSMLVGRLGSVVGSVVIGALIKDYCNQLFIMPVVLLLSSAVLAFTIPNIGKRIK